MSDTKCRGTVRRHDTATPYVCPWRSICWRHVRPDGPWQAWFGEAPIEWDPLTGAPSCRYREPLIRIVDPAQPRAN